MIELYRELCDEILEILKSDNINDEKLKLCFDKRAEIIENIEEDKIEVFKKAYKEELENKDNEIKILLQKSINEVKKEMLQYRKNVSANSAYVNMNRKKMNIFSTKI